MISIIITVIIVIYLVIPLIKWCRKRVAYVKTIDKIPGNKAYPLVGTTYTFFSVDRKDLFKVIDNIDAKYPYISRDWFGFKAEISIRKAEYVENVINSSKHLEKSFIYDYVKIWLGDGLLISKGQKWFKHRKIITTTFHFSILETFCEIFAEKSNILVERLNNHADTGDTINIHEFVTNCALDIISESAMGIQMDAQRQHENEYLNAIYDISELIIYRFFRLWLSFDFIYKRTATGKKFQKCLDILHPFTKEVIKNRKMAREENRRKGIPSKKRQAFLDLLLDANEKENVLSDEDIREEVDTFMFEGVSNLNIKAVSVSIYASQIPSNIVINKFLGHDTTASGITWTLYILGLYPDVEQKVLEELNSIFHGSNRPAVLEDLNEMKYLERVIKESMRLYPPVPLIGRTLSEDIQLDQYKIPKGTTVSVGIYHLHRDPLVFPDPEKFDPDRFLPENTKGRNPYAYLPFSAGPRNCVGQKFAMYEEKSVLSSVIQNFKLISVDQRDEINLLSELILKTHNGINLKLERRK